MLQATPSSTSHMVENAMKRSVASPTTPAATPDAENDLAHPSARAPPVALGGNYGGGRLTVREAAAGSILSGAALVSRRRRRCWERLTSDGGGGSSVGGGGDGRGHKRWAALEGVPLRGRLSRACPSPTPRASTSGPPRSTNAAVIGAGRSCHRARSCRV